MDLWPSKGQSRGPEPRAGAPLPGQKPRFLGWQLGAACRSRSPLPAMRRQAGPGWAETHVPSRPSTFPGLHAGASTPPPAQAVHAERGWGAGTSPHTTAAEQRPSRHGRAPWLLLRTAGPSDLPTQAAHWA